MSGICGFPIPVIGKAELSGRMETFTVPCTKRVGHTRINRTRGAADLSHSFKAEWRSQARFSVKPDESQ